MNCNDACFLLTLVFLREITKNHHNFTGAEHRQQSLLPLTVQVQHTSSANYFDYETILRGRGFIPR
jgi:hypothetical protein